MPKVVEGEPPDDPADLTTDYEQFTNHGRLEDDDEVMATFADFVKRGFLKEFETLDDCVAFLDGEKPILNKFACLSKWRWDADVGIWKEKKRVIMDSKRSGVKGASHRKYKSVLPRTTDAVGSLLAALSDCRGTERTAEQFVIDATDAFWELGLRPEERRFFVGMLRGKYLVYLRTAQGSRGAPLSWAAVFGLICRCVQSLFFKGTFAITSRAKFSVDLQVYVDDPWAVVSGTDAQRERSLSLMILTWRVIGVKLAFSKARRGPRVDWIGASLHIEDSLTVVASIMKARVDELKRLTSDMLLVNIVPLKELRSFTGKVQSMAGLLHTWRPFVAMLWAALYADTSVSGAPAGCVWTAQLREPLNWLTAFLAPASTNLVRRFGVDAHFNKGKAVLIYVDASPFGLGAWLSVDEEPVAYFADKFSDLDCVMLLIEKNEGSKGQQAFEALALLAAIRLWLPAFAAERVSVCVRSDNMAALHMVAKMQPKSAALGVVARELALDLADATYALDFAQHVAGITNGIADMLSRKHDPSKTFVLPDLLAGVPEAVPQLRDRRWWRTMPVD